MISRIVFGSDHHGVAVKEQLLLHLKHRGYELHDYGAFGEDAADYPLYAKDVAEEVSNNPDTVRGILLCASGVGMCMVANRFPHVRAGVSWSTKHAALIRTDDDTNILCLPVAFLHPHECVAIVDAWLATPFSGAERHVRRLSQLAQLDRITPEVKSSNTSGVGQEN